MTSASSDFFTFRTEMKKALRKKYGRLACPTWGNQKAKIVSISQAPSLSVIKNQKPFSDKSGEKLRKWYRVSDEIFYNPDNFYFTAIGMYFPGKDKKGTDLKPSFQWASEWLNQELSYLNPKLLLVLGQVAANFFFPKKDFINLVFEDQQIKGVPVLVLPHPSPVNIKWFKDHPEFENQRLPEVRRHIHLILKV